MIHLNQVITVQHFKNKLTKGFYKGREKKSMLTQDINDVPEMRLLLLSTKTSTGFQGRPLVAHTWEKAWVLSPPFHLPPL